MTDQERNLYPELTAEEAETAIVLLKNYFEVALDIARQGSPSQVDNELALSTMKERSNVHLKT